MLKVSTGAGKTTVGLLYLYGFMRVSKEPVVFLCPTVQLVDQVLDEALRLGIQARAYPAGETYPAQECVRGDAIIVCTYEKLFNAKSTFARSDVNLVPHAIVLDDAHAGVENIRKQFTLTVTGEAYEQLLRILRPACSKYHQTKWTDIENRDPAALLEVPHWIWSDHHTDVLAALHGFAGTQEFVFVWPYLRGMLNLCRCVISGDRAEISPEVLPTDQVRGFSRAKHRLFMSATLADDSLLTRELGVTANATTQPILPLSDRGLGERMILAPSLVDPDLDRGYVMDLCAELAQQYNVVVLTSSSTLAADWVQKGATYFKEDTFATGVRLLKNAHSGMRFAVFAQRFDGVDLPDDACRVLVIDGVPYGAGLTDKVDSEMTTTPGGARNRTIFRIEQGMGRPVRSHADYAVVLLSGQDLTTYVARKDVLQAMTQDSQNQLNLCVELAELVRKNSATKNPDAAIRQVILQCLDRDPGWKKYYNQKIRDAVRKQPMVDASAVKLANEERRAHLMAFDNQLADAATTFNRAIQEARLDGEELGIYLQRLARVAYLSNPAEAMKIQQSARERNRTLAIPVSMPCKPRVLGGKTVAEKLLAWFGKFSNPDAAVLEARKISDALDLEQSPAKVEAAIAQLGDALGAESSRPEEEYRLGPDNLWFWGNLVLVIEAKSGNEVSLHKKDSGQLHDSLQWATEAFPDQARRLQPIIVARVTKVDSDAHFAQNTRVLTQHGCSTMGSALHHLVQKLAQLGPIFRTPELVLREMHEFGLHPDQFIAKHTVRLD